MSSARSARSRTLPLSAFHSEVGGGAPDVAAPDELPRGPVEGGGVAHPGSRGHAELLESNAAREPSAISTGGASSVSLDTFKSAVDLCLREFLGVGGACIGHCPPLACNLLRFTACCAPAPAPARAAVHRRRRGGALYRRAGGARVAPAHRQARSDACNGPRGARA